MTRDTNLKVGSHFHAVFEYLVGNLVILVATIVPTSSQQVLAVTIL